MSPRSRSNVFFVYNSVANAAVAPFGGTAPRPEFIASPDFTPV
jgi:ectoine hydroxylase